MSKRRAKIHPSMQVHGGPGDDLLDQIDREAEQSMLEDDEFIRGREIDEDSDDDDEDEDPQPRRRSDPRDDQIANLQRQIDLLTRAIPPAAPSRSAAEPEPDEFDSIDWDQELFQNPKGALKRYGELQAKKIRTELRAEYDQDQSSKTFWKDFYAQNKDLSDDHDLVESTMGKHMNEIANMPVSQAIKKLGDLTRARISRYSQRGSTKNRRALSEGAEAPTSEARRQPSEERLTHKTMSELISQRRRKRRGAAA